LAILVNAVAGVMSDEKQRKRLREEGGLSNSPLKSVFDSSQLSGSINVQDGGTTSFPKTNHGSRSKIRLLCRLASGLKRNP